MREIVSKCVSDSILTKDTFVLALECYRNINDAQAALQLYNQTTQQSPDVNTTAALSVLLSVLSKSSTKLSEEGISIYRAALLDSSFTGLRFDQRVALSALGLYLNTRTTSAELLDDAVHIKTSLQEAGVALNPAVYTTLIRIASRMNNYTMCKSLFEESLAAGVTNNVASEAALLAAAIQNDAIGDCLAIYTRLGAQGSHALNSDVVDQMLGLCKRTGQQQLGLSVLTQWHSTGGALTWPICNRALDLFLTHALIAKLSSTAASSVWTVIPPSADTNWSPKQLKAYQKHVTEMPAVVVEAALRQVMLSLKSFQDRSAYVQTQQLTLDSFAAEDPTELPVVPIDILTRLAPLITIRGNLDLVMARLELPLSFGTGVRLQQHQQVLTSLALDLAELGHWRQLVSLTKRLRSYSSTQDSLYYGASTMLQLHTFTFVCLMRAGQLRRAQDVARSHILSSLPITAAISDSKIGPISALIQALERAGAGGLSMELAFVAQQGVAVLEAAQAQVLVTAILMQCTTVSDLLLCLTSLHKGAINEVSGDSGAAPGERFRLSERHLDMINSVQCNACTTEDKATVAKCSELVESLRTHEPML